MKYKCKRCKKIAKNQYQYGIWIWSDEENPLGWRYKTTLCKGCLRELIKWTKKH